MAHGSCLCGDISYDYDEQAAGASVHCHCRDCQRVTGSGKATVVLFPESAVTISGDYKRFSNIGSDGSHVNRGFCPNCGSQMFTFVDEIPGNVFIKAGTMDDSTWLEVAMNCWESTANPWSPPNSALPGVERNPEL